jgi:quercetin dioxygenase-like cupin family protein
LKLINYREVEAVDAEHGAENVRVRWLITKEDGAEHFAMRLFEMASDGHTPYHSHAWEHEVFILDGHGHVILGDEERVFNAGDVIFIPGNLRHRFRNTGAQPVRFLCLIPYL